MMSLMLCALDAPGSSASLFVFLHVAPAVVPWIESCRHLQAPKSRIIFATKGYITYKWKKQDTNVTYPPCAPLEVAIGTQDGDPKAG